MISNTEKIKQELQRDKLIPIGNKKSDYLSTGSTLLNLALTGRWYGGFIKGTYILFVGDTDSGKSFLCMTCLAEASINPDFDDYRFLYINKERGVLMDIEGFFGQAVAERLEMTYCENLEEMYFFLDDVLKDKRPFICIVDSIDSMSTEYEGKKFEERKRASRKGTKAKGDYGDGKAQMHSRNIRRVLSGLEKTGSIIVFINQSRDNIDAGPFSSKDTHSGGRAISFYATMKIWSKKIQTLTREYKDKKRQIGIRSEVKVVRTRSTGQQHAVEFPIFHSFGIDDLGGCIDYLIDEKHWSKTSGSIKAPEFDFEGSRKKLIRLIEENNYEDDLRMIVAGVWKDIQEACKVQRKKRY